MGTSAAARLPVDSPEPAEVAPVANGFHREPRCRVCRNDAVREKVNGLLARGASYASSCAPSRRENAELDQCASSVDSVRTHSGRHFPVQNVAKRPTGRSWSAGRGRTSRLRRGRGHRAHADGAVRDGHGEGLRNPHRPGHHGGREHRHARGRPAAGPGRVEGRGDQPGRDHREDEPRHRGGALDRARVDVAGDQAQARGRRRARRAAGGGGLRGFGRTTTRSSPTTISTSSKTDAPPAGPQANGGSRSVGAVERVA